MSKWRFWQKRDDDQSSRSVPEGPSAERRRPVAAPPAAQDPMASRRLAELERRRQDARFEVEQSEAALTPDNPWQSRIDLLTEALATIEADRQAIDAVPPAPTFLLPSTPITDVRATADEPSEVSFTIGDHRFLYREATDWDQRGGPTVRGDLRRQEGEPASLLPATTPPGRRDGLTRHLSDSLDVFATDLRDRALDGDALPASPTLADLARPCPDCGGWQDWNDRCPECARRQLRRQALRAEADRLESERTAEAEERHRLTERLPIARRRLTQIESDLAALDTKLRPSTE